jgi:hypothetical protein
VTLDTTRADAIGPEARGVETPAFDALARRGLRFRQAYATVPETLPSHSSMMTGLYPAGHGVHENGRFLGPALPVVAERLRGAGYRTAAFVSSFALARRFGLARGFDVYDDEPAAGRAERSARETTARALADLRANAKRPRFLWVHYYDPHAPYAPPEPFATRYAKAPYLGEVAAMDEQLGILVAEFERSGSPTAVLVAGDHGEGLGEHGESRHGDLLYQGTMHVPLLLAGPGVAAGVVETPVSTRHVFHTILDFAGLGAADSLRAPQAEVVLGEAMKPFLEYGWQPQVMAVEGRIKAIQAGRMEAYDVVADPGEARDLAVSSEPPRPLRTALRDYPVPAPTAAGAPATLDEEARRKLASLGYVGGGAAPVIRKDAPRPAEMTRLFDVLERASDLFVREEYARAIPLLEQIRAQDPYNLDAVLRLATAHSALGHDAPAAQAFAKAAEIAPGSPDVRAYLALHYARGKDWPRATPLLEQVIADSWRRWRAFASGRDGPAMRRTCGRGSTRSGQRARPSRFAWASWPCARNARRSPSSRSSGPGRRRDRPSPTTSSWASSIWTRGGSRRRGTPWSASPRHIPPTRWRSSSAPRPASCSASRIRRSASRPRGGMRMPSRGR